MACIRQSAGDEKKIVGEVMKEVLEGIIPKSRPVPHSPAENAAPLPPPQVAVTQHKVELNLLHNCQ